MRRKQFKVQFKSSYLRIVILQVIEVCLGFEEQLHDGRGVWHELVTAQKEKDRCEVVCLNVQ